MIDPIEYFREYVDEHGYGETPTRPPQPKTNGSIVFQLPQPTPERRLRRRVTHAKVIEIRLENLRNRNS